MSIRRRLMLSYIAMIVIPLVVTLLSISAIVGGRGHRDDRMDVKQQFRVLGQLEMLVAQDAERFRDNGYLDGINRTLAENDAVLLRYENGRIVNRVAPEWRDIDWFHVDRERTEGLTRYNLVRLNDELIFVTEESDVTRIIFVVILSLLGVVVTNIVLSYWMSRSLLRPIRTLKEAATKIEEGELQFAVTSKANDELGDLTRAFEQMRLRLKQSLDEVQQQEENRKQLVANISHDLKTPITSIQGYIQGIEDGVANTPEKMQRYLATIRRKTTELDQLINTLFLFSKLDLNKEPFHLRPTRIRAFLEELWLADEWSAVELQIEGDAVVSLDYEKMQRVLTNLAHNSMKYMGRDGAIRFAVQCEQTAVHFAFSDEGNGVTDEQLAHLFTDFYRADEARSAATGGSGLGLAIVKRLIEGHGGTVAAYHNAPHGLTIRWTLERVE